MPASRTSSTGSFAAQILINLTNNAIKFTDERFVRIGMRQDEENGSKATTPGVRDRGRGSVLSLVFRH